MELWLATTDAGFADWRQLLWPIGGVLTLVSLVLVLSWYWNHRQKERQPLLFLLEQILWHFRQPLLLVTAGSLLLIAMGFTAGSQVSLVLFVLLSALTVVGIGVIAWWLWPRDTADGNLFDMIPLPDLEWPAYENRYDRQMRGWVEHRTKEVKSDPPDFAGATFGAIALEVVRESAKIYEKQTPLSVSLDDLLRGVERTAADLKILCNHLPLAGHFTLAGIERQIEVAVKRGRLLYAFVFLILSFFNPGNLLRVALAFFQQKSPWEHILIELQAWVYGHYTERLGYHMSLIHSRRKPPPADALHEAFAQQRTSRGQTIRRQKLGWLAFLGLFGFAAYMLLQLANITLVYGGGGFLLGASLLGVCVYGVWGLRDPRRWELLWDSLMPKWPEEAPLEGEKERLARGQMAEVLRKYREPPVLEKMEDAKALPELYGQILLETWQACYGAYRHPEESDFHRASREFYLPQGFAGIEELCRALHIWFNGTTILPRTLRQLERFGFDLESLYTYIQKQSDVEQGIEVEETPEAPEAPKPEALEATAPAAEGESVEGVDPQQPEAAPEAREGKGVLGWFGRVGRSIGNFATKFATKQLHQRMLEQLSEGIGERLIDIYGARHPRTSFEPHEAPPETRNILLLGRDPQQLQELLYALHELPLPTESPLASPDGEEPQPMADLELPDGVMVRFDCIQLPRNDDDRSAIESLQDLLEFRPFHRVLLIDTIDYGARERVARLLESHFVESLRSQNVGSMALALLGVEKLKPLRWEPPYDDYLQEQPEKRKSQRIRNAVLAWAEVFREFRALEAIYPLGAVAGEESWGYPSLRRFLGLPDGREELLGGEALEGGSTLDLERAQVQELLEGEEQPEPRDAKAQGDEAADATGATDAKETTDAADASSEPRNES